MRETREKCARYNDHVASSNLRINIVIQTLIVKQVPDTLKKLV